MTHTSRIVSDHLEAIRFAAATAKELGLRVAITSGSGWPFGGAHVQDSACDAVPTIRCGNDTA